MRRYGVTKEIVRFESYGRAAERDARGEELSKHTAGAQCVAEERLISRGRPVDPARLFVRRRPPSAPSAQSGRGQ